MSAPLTLIVAPAGAGKTVLLSQWIQSRPDLGVAWIDVEAADDDSVHFAQRIVARLEAVDPRLSDLEATLGEPGGGLGADMVEALGGALEDVGRQVVVILDDLHHLSNRSTVEDLWILADRLPANAHLIFSSRTDLRLSWSRHRLQHGLVELRRAELAFDQTDTAAVLMQITGRHVDEDTAATVLRHTEGWAAGVQLVALTLRLHSGSDAVVDALDATDRQIVDYLSQEVLDAQTPERRQALLALSVLDEMSPGLVHTLTDAPDAGGFLRDLEDESMFVLPVPGRRDWYRFHHLFRDLLRYRLRASDPGAEVRLLRRAAAWHLAADDSSAAVECLLRARLWSDALDLILQRGRREYELGHTATVTRWLSMVPQEVRVARPDVRVLYGIMSGMTGRAVEAEETFRQIISDPATDDGHRLVAAAYLSAIVPFRPHPETYLADALNAVRLLQELSDVVVPDILQLTSRELLMTMACVSAGRAHLYLGQLDEARGWLETALGTAGGRYPPFRIHCFGVLSVVEAWSGSLRAATQHADEALDIARETSLLAHSSTADAYLARAIVAIQRGEPEVGAISLHEGNLRAASNQRSQIMWIAHAASKLIDPLGTDVTAIEPTGSPPPIVRRALLAARHRAARQAGEPHEAIEPQRGWSMLAFEEIAALLAEANLPTARERLEQIPFRADSQKPASEVEHRILSGWLFALEGHSAPSRAELVSALEVAGPEWLVHPFIRAGRAVSQLIDALPGPPDRFRSLVVRLSQRVGRGGTDQLAEPLTSRELEVLAYLPTRLTNVEIAARCYVSVNTIKTHTAHIYRKLDVLRRSDAVARARELGLLTVSAETYTL
ncbi:LuxR C-terminal-related transcriptional regulator [Microbacterium sp. LWH3-1.2]|uniref:LuxR C-terminal-related transcriptional regulator n=1 Tax=Microbacterium sp. LWH3-1.2 TaxID=3135256 RepID=UPI0034218E77